MNLNELKSLIKWAKEIGIETVGELQEFQKSVCRDNSNGELLNKLNGYFVHNIKFKEVYYV